MDCNCTFPIDLTPHKIPMVMNMMIALISRARKEGKEVKGDYGGI